MYCAKWKITQFVKPVTMIVGFSQGDGRGLEEDKGGTVVSGTLGRSQEALHR